TVQGGKEAIGALRGEAAHPADNWRVDPPPIQFPDSIDQPTAVTPPAPVVAEPVAPAAAPPVVDVPAPPAPAVAEAQPEAPAPEGAAAPGAVAAEPAPPAAVHEFAAYTP